MKLGLGILLVMAALGWSACLEKASSPPTAQGNITGDNADDTGAEREDFALHNPPPCEACHADDRPAEPHNQDADCFGCHAYPDFTAPQATFNHNPLPSACNSCHEEDRPAEPHVQGGDCASCHLFPSFQQVITQ